MDRMISEHRRLKYYQDLEQKFREYIKYKDGIDG